MAQAQTCGICDGKGYFRCPICHGKGLIKKDAHTHDQNESRVDEEAETCHSCQGIGKLLCNTCGGSGRILIEKPDSTSFKNSP